MDPSVSDQRVQPQAGVTTTWTAVVVAVVAAWGPVPTYPIILSKLPFSTAPGATVDSLLSSPLQDLLRRRGERMLDRLVARRHFPSRPTIAVDVAADPDPVPGEKRKRRRRLSTVLAHLERDLGLLEPRPHLFPDIDPLGPAEVPPPGEEIRYAVGMGHGPTIRAVIASRLTALASEDPSPDRLEVLAWQMYAKTYDGRLQPGVEDALLTEARRLAEGCGSAGVAACLRARYLVSALPDGRIRTRVLKALSAQVVGARHDP
jgi:hypothetical protein